MLYNVRFLRIKTDTTDSISLHYKLIAQNINRSKNVFPGVNIYLENDLFIKMHHTKMNYLNGIRWKLPQKFRDLFQKFMYQ